MKRRLLGLWVVACGSSLISLAPPAWTQGVPTQPDSADHYITYRVVDPVDNLTHVILSDQFLVNTTFEVGALNRLLVPMDKSHAAGQFPMLFPDLHYKWWWLQPIVTVNRSVIVRNQFSNNSRWRILFTEFILAPALKSAIPGVDPPDILPNENHYLCYRASEDTIRASIPIGFRDQFQTGTTLVGDAEYLCTPCRKTRLEGGLPPTTYDIVRPDVHLALYRVDRLWPQTPVSIRDQFGLHRVFIHQNGLEYVVVPSFKHEIPVPVMPRTWGQIKSMHR